MRIGHFSLIQYSRDPAREEWTNLGVVVATSTEVHVKLAPTALERLHLPEAVHTVAERSLAGLVARLRRVQPREDASALVELRGCEGGHVNISAPRPTEVVTVEATATDIIKTLVWSRGAARPSRKRRDPRQDPTQLLLPLVVGVGLTTTRVTVGGRDLKAVTYTNGRTNYIHGRKFSGNERSVLGAARELGAMGVMLERQPDPDTALRRHLMVFADFRDHSLEPKVREVLEALDTELFTVEQQDLLEKRIRADVAHE